MRLEKWLYIVPLRLRSLFRKSQVESELGDELQFHCEQKTREYVAAGLSLEDARRAARREFGGLEQSKENCRDARRVNFLEDLLQDLRFGLRMFRNSPVFALAAILTLALGIGANTAIFSVVNGVLLRPLPFPKQERLMMLWEKDSDGLRSNTSWATFMDWSKLNHSFTEIAAISFWSPTFIGQNDAETLNGFRVSSTFFDLMGVKFAYGRNFLPSEDVRGNQMVVILSYGFWQRRFGGDPQIVGKTIRLGSVDNTVVGILPADFPSVLSFDPRKPADIYTPLAYNASLPYACRDCHHLRAIARLRDGVSMSQAAAEMNQISANLYRQYPSDYSAPGVILTPLKDYLVGDVQTTLWVLLGSVAFVLLIACVNVANLLLAWAARRNREVALRAALGARRIRMIRQFLTESLLLSLIGGVVALFLASGGIALLQQLRVGNLPRLQNIRTDGWTFFFTFAISVLTGIAFGLAPAFRSAKVDLIEALKETGKSTAGRERHRLRYLLVVSDVALALLLLTGAGLMMKSFVRILEVKPGLDPSNTLTLTVSLWGPKSQDAPAAAFFQQVLQRVQALPGVESAGIVSQLPLGGNLDMYGIHVEGKTHPNPEDDPSADRYSISPGYLQAMRIPLLRGRGFDDHDIATSNKVVLVNESMVRQFWPNEDPIGKRLRMGDTTGPWKTVVGVVGDVLHRGLDAPHTIQIYLPYTQFTDSLAILVVRASHDPASLAPAVRSTIAALDPQVPISDVATMQEVVSASVANQRFGVLLFAIFAAIALFLAALGIYGVISYGVIQRTHEIGIRVALGARRAEVLRLIVGEAMRPAMLGAVLGLGAAFGLTRLLGRLLYSVKPSDPPTYALVVLILIAVALFASYIPARRATRVDPMVALRYE
ncbi:MAG TPA: ABC transporter permease [Candidatus Methylomirabilis sp.]|nr:ABC transporter permease [Candidatus Methylomirabilis sp.]